MKLLTFTVAFAVMVALFGRAWDHELARAHDPPVTLEQPGFRYQGWTARTWAKRAVQARKDANARGRTIRRLKGELARRYEPTFEDFWTVAAIAYGVDRATLERKTRCESVNMTDFHNPSGATGAMQFILSTWESTPYGHLDRMNHLANVMAGAWMHSVGRGGEWVCR